MSSTPAHAFECPRCRTSLDELSNFCPECGTDMTQAELDPALAQTEQPETRVIDRRLSDSNQAWLGKIVDGRYRVLEVIGRGGMGVVYRVEHLRMGKMAAMKVLHRDLAQDPEVIARFEREATSVSKLANPHTVQVFDFGNANGALYLIMELVRGQDLSRIIERDGPLPWSRAAGLFAQICGALQEAHSLGIIHRDLKPENVLITRTTGGRDFAKVLDFGLAKLDRRDAPKRETERQAIVGTPYFMSPEQIRGDEVDARTDIYSLGALMFEVLTGEHLYSGSTAVGVLTKHLTGEPDAPSMRVPKLGIPPQVDHLCKKALRRDPTQRWRSAADFAAAIEEVYAETVTDSTGARPTASRALRGGALALEDTITESDLRLRRSDIDAYEAGLKRQRWLSIVVLLLVFGGAIAGAVWYLMRPVPPLTSESEANDTPETANRIAPGKITGYLGKRRSLTEGDRDVYRVEFPAGKRVITVTASGISNLDLSLAIADRNGHAASVDEGGVGEGESVHRRAIDGPVTITIDETVAKGTRPVENVSDPYTLTVTEEAIQGGEVEPNGSETDANPIALKDPVSGYLDTKDDVDLLRFTGANGTYSVTVKAEFPLIWQTSDGMQRTPGVASLPLRHDEIIRIQRSPKDPPKRDAPWGILISP